jgi:hypothetical protein
MNSLDAWALLADSPKQEQLKAIEKDPDGSMDNTAGGSNVDHSYEGSQAFEEPKQSVGSLQAELPNSIRSMKRSIEEAKDGSYALDPKLARLDSLQESIAMFIDGTPAPYSESYSDAGPVDSLLDTVKSQDADTPSPRSSPALRSPSSASRVSHNHSISNID